jgi:hypothetical protein
MEYPIIPPSKCGFSHMVKMMFWLLNFEGAGGATFWLSMFASLLTLDGECHLNNEGDAKVLMVKVATYHLRIIPWILPIFFFLVIANVSVLSFT